MRRKFLLIVLFLIILSGSSLCFYIYMKQVPDNTIQVFDDSRKQIQNTVKYFDTKYSINDMYDLISKHEIPNDDEFYDILLNWYDYYSEGNLFINWFGEEFTIDEYEKIRKKYSGDTLKVLLISAPKSWFLPVLNE